MTCSHYLRNTVCRNCDKESKFALKSPNKSNIGWFGGCGSFECTGDYNILIHD